MVVIVPGDETEKLLDRSSLSDAFMDAEADVVNLRPIFFNACLLLQNHTRTTSRSMLSLCESSIISSAIKSNY